MQKDKLVLVTDPDMIAAIERNGFGDPVPAHQTDEGYWVYQWSLEQYREQLLQRERSKDSGVVEMPD